ncbi:MAG: sporulation integral membrane protein YtvI [Clostridiaceae bacterium]|nr:sporulation integral membrane protein YtvI [Clostridiaceae bacterium]
METVRHYTRVILNIIIPMITIYLVCFWGPKLLKFFMPFVIGWIIAMIANPLVRFLENRVKIVRKLGSVLIVVSVLALVIGVIYLVISKLIVEGASFIKDLPALYDTASHELHQAFLRMDHLFIRLPSGIQDSLNQFSENIGEYLNLAVQKIASPTVTMAGNVAKGIPGALVNSIITILSSYMFIAERDKIVEFWKKYAPKGSTKYVSLLRSDIKRLIGGYFAAQFKIMLVVAFILFAGFFVLGVDYAFLLALLIAFLDFLPLFGTGTALIPWALVKLLSGEYAFAAGLALLYVLTQVVRQVIQPKIVGDTMGIPPLWTLFFLYIGFKFSGISGMILAVPVGMLFLNLYEHGAFDSMIDNIRILVHDIDEFRRGDKQ